MRDFFDDIETGLKTKLSGVYNEMLALREHRAGLLEPYDLGRTDELLDKIKSGEISEHPAYDHYLAVQAITKELEPMREKCQKILEEA
ncbi:MAG: hypothetical protein OEV42_10390 [Deltaproteobacteria bacterium]|nr:hypothetical protein [Deltaproteobacteria bacterium]